MRCQETRRRPNVWGDTISFTSYSKGWPLEYMTSGKGFKPFTYGIIQYDIGQRWIASPVEFPAIYRKGTTLMWKPSVHTFWHRVLGDCMSFLAMELLARQPQSPHIMEALEDTSSDFLGVEWYVVFKGTTPSVYPTWYVPPSGFRLKFEDALTIYIGILWPHKCFGCWVQCTTCSFRKRRPSLPSTWLYGKVAS
jgi:hypothetical protein